MRFLFCSHFNIETLVENEIGIDLFIEEVKLLAAFFHAAVSVERIKIILSVGLTLFSILYLLQQFGVLVEARLFADAVPCSET